MSEHEHRRVMISGALRVIRVGSVCGVCGSRNRRSIGVCHVCGSPLRAAVAEAGARAGAPQRARRRLAFVNVAVLMVIGTVVYILMKYGGVR